MPDQLSKALSRLLGKYQQAMQATPARMGRADGALAVPGKANVIYVTELDGPCVEVLNQRVFPEEVDKLVLIGYDPIHFPQRRQVLSLWDAYPEAGNLGVGPHGDTHGVDSSDPVFISSRQYLDGLVVPVAGSLSVQIYPDTYQTNSGYKTYTEITALDFSASVPTSGARAALLVVDGNGDFVIRNGNIVPNYNLVDNTALPAAEPGDTVRYAIVCYAGQTEAVDTTTQRDLVDLRFSAPAKARTLPATIAANDFLVGDGTSWLARTLAQTVTILRTALDSVYAALVSPAFTGNPTAPTPIVGDNSTSLATTAFVMAQRGDILSGSVLPTNPINNQLFLHKTALRTVLYQYVNGAWSPNFAYGDFNLYVDYNLGTDSLEYGDAPGAGAVKTITYALSIMPPQGNAGANLWIAENTILDDRITFIGKKYPNLINVTGTRTTLDSGTCTSYNTGGGTVYSTITDTSKNWGVDEFKGKMILFTGLAERVVLSNTANTITIVGVFSFIPTTYSISDCTSVITSSTTTRPITIWANQTGLAFKNLKFLSNLSAIVLLPSSKSAATFTNCVFDNATSKIMFQPTGCDLTFSACYFSQVGQGVMFNGVVGGIHGFGHCYFRELGATRSGTGLLFQGCMVGANQPNYFENLTTGIQVTNFSFINLASTLATGYVVINNCTTGFSVGTTSSFLGTVGISPYFANCITDVNHFWSLGRTTFSNLYAQNLGAVLITNAFNNRVALLQVAGKGQITEIVAQVGQIGELQADPRGDGRNLSNISHLTQAASAPRNPQMGDIWIDEG